MVLFLLVQIFLHIRYSLHHEEIIDWFGPHVDYVVLGKSGTCIPSKICDLLSGETIRSN